MGTEWKVGDRGLFGTVPFGVVGVYLPKAVVLFDGAMIATHFEIEDLDKHATKVEPPYVPQVGDIVSVNGSSTLFVVRSSDDGSVQLVGGEHLYPFERLTLVVRKGEVYQ